MCRAMIAQVQPMVQRLAVVTEQAYHNNTVSSHNATDMTYVASISGNQKGWFTVGSASFSGGEGAHCRYAKGVFSDGTSKDNIIVFSAEL